MKFISTFIYPPLHWLWFAIKTVSVLLLIVGIGITAFLYLAPTFGGSATGESLEKMQASSNYKNNRFVNLQETRVDTRAAGEPLNLGSFFFPPEGKNPQQPLPSLKLDSNNLNAGDFVWLGHSTVLFNNHDLMILSDPIFHRASPVPFIGEPFELEQNISIEDLPAIDVVVISHDHYDHLDHLAVAKLNPKTKQFLVPLGVGAHLLRWGVHSSKITEFDWFESTTVSNTQFTFTPSRHFSGRGITNRFSTLWGSWVVKSEQSSVFFSGDSGYFDGFKDIGEQFGPFDIAFIENGAYNPNWSEIHMMPEQSVQASVDLQAAVFFPIHWSKFDLSLHQWKDPIERASVAADALGVNITTPLIGEVFQLQALPKRTWWKNL